MIRSARQGVGSKKGCITYHLQTGLWSPQTATAGLQSDLMETKTRDRSDLFDITSSDFFSISPNSFSLSLKKYHSKCNHKRIRPGHVCLLPKLNGQVTRGKEREREREREKRELNQKNQKRERESRKEWNIPGLGVVWSWIHHQILEVCESFEVVSLPDVIWPRT